MYIKVNMVKNILAFVALFRQVNAKTVGLIFTLL